MRHLHADGALKLLCVSLRNLRENILFLVHAEFAEFAENSR